jgi:ribosomal protein RSM22 (predicted rRNA methylase)
MTNDPHVEPQRMLTLPDDLRQAIERALAAVPAARWMRAAQQLSERYRGARPANEQPLATGAREALGYAALIMPATYAQLRGALAATAARIPAWAPTTMLDLGSGPGTALWAASAQWPTLHALSAYEREPALIALGRDLARASAVPAMRSARWERADLRQATFAGTYDLVVLGHVLNELDPAARRQVVAAAWAATAGVLLIVEPGTAPAFEVVRAARDDLLTAGARTLAPCAHDRPCPLAHDWCHFPQRLQRPEFQRRARAAPSQWEDAKFAYAALARFAPDAPIWGRVIHEPTSNKAYAEVEISTCDGIVHYRALKRHREHFRLVKDLAWGQALSEPLPEERS